MDTLHGIRHEEFNAIIEQTWEMIPQLKSRLYPRRYIRPTGYGCQERAAKQMAHLLMSATALAAPDPLTAATAACIDLWADLGTPQFWLSESLSAAFACTGVQDQLDITSLKWPHQAFVLHVPSAIAQSTGAPAGCGEWFLVARGTSRPNETAPGSEVLVVATIATAPPYITYYGAHPLSAIPMAQSTNLDLYFKLTQDDTGQSIQAAPPISDPWESALLTLGLRLAAMTLFWANHRAEGSPSPQVARPETRKNGKVHREQLWHPIILGHGYSPGRTNRTASETNSHRSPSMHPRRGHLRNQAHGEKLLLRKVIWIEPTLVGS